MLITPLLFNRETFTLSQPRKRMHVTRMKCFGNFFIDIHFNETLADPVGRLRGLQPLPFEFLELKKNTGNKTNKQKKPEEIREKE